MLDYLPIIGLHGVAGAGKDTVFERIRELGGTRYRQASFAAPLKQSAAALLDVSVETLEAMKRNPELGITVWHPGEEGERGVDISTRTLLQRMGTEVGRQIFGEDFWVDLAMRQLDRARRQDGMLRVGPYTYVYTDVRFPNEAQAIIDRGGQVWRVEGPQDAGADGHPSEEPLPAELIAVSIDNTHREMVPTDGGDGMDGHAHVFIPNYEHLDDQVIGAIHR